MKPTLTVLIAAVSLGSTAMAAVPAFEREYSVFSAHTYTPSQGAPSGLITKVNGDTDTRSQTVGLWVNLNASLGNNTYNLFKADTGAGINPQGFAFSLVKSVTGFSLQYQYGEQSNRTLTANIDASLLTSGKTQIVLVTEKSASARTAKLSLYVNNTLLSWSGSGCASDNQNTTTNYTNDVAPYISTNFNGNDLASMTLGSNGLALSYAKVYTSALSADEALALLPEPTTTTLGLLGFAALGLRRRRA